ncbi:MAG: hypothetical protein OYH77_04225, partial [Pseudomonadota bacterium]|nr:hypothetical protein [Pseudomonadota bacterium]
EARAPSASGRLAAGINKITSKLLPFTGRTRAAELRTGEHNKIQQLIAGAGMMFIICTTSLGIVSCSNKKMIHDSKPLVVAQFTAAELEAGDYVHVRIDGNSYAASILEATTVDGREGVRVELFSDGFEGEGGVERDITLDQVIGTQDIFHADNGKQVLVTGLDLERAMISDADAERVILGGFSNPEHIFYHGIITTKFSDGSMEVMLSSKVYVHHLDGEHNQLITSLTEPIFTLIGADNLVAPPYK